LSPLRLGLHNVGKDRVHKQRQVAADVEKKHPVSQRLTMRRVRELLRLHYEAGASARTIARELGVSRSTVKEYLARAAAAELT
jgi:response regulator of citrate/malate metabolism